MPTYPRKHSDATQIIEEILKEAATPRQSASVKEALEKKKKLIALEKPEAQRHRKQGRDWNIRVY